MAIMQAWTEGRDRSRRKDPRPGVAVGFLCPVGDLCSWEWVEYQRVTGIGHPLALWSSPPPEPLPLAKVCPRRAACWSAHVCVPAREGPAQRGAGHSRGEDPSSKGISLAPWRSFEARRTPAMSDHPFSVPQASDRPGTLSRPPG